jgi:hypothetical protein
MANCIFLTHSESTKLVKKEDVAEYTVYIPYEDGYIDLGGVLIEGNPWEEGVFNSLFEPEDLEETIESLDHDCSGRTATVEEFWSSYSECLKNPDLVMFNPVPHEMLDIENISAKIYEEFRNELIAETLSK